MAWKKAEDEKPKENNEKEIETLQPEFNKQYELRINRMGEKDGKDWFIVEDTEEVEWWLPNHYDLRNKLKQFDIQEGDYILIEHVEDKDIGKENPLKIYDVYWDDGTGD
jgi:hypothetical protein